MKKKMIVVMIVVMSLFCKNVQAVEGEKVGAIIVISGLYASSIWIPVNIIDGVHERGQIVESTIGIGSGALQILIGSSLGGVTGAATSSEKAVGIPLVILGAANIGAGIFSLTHQGPKRFGVGPGVGTQEGLKPGFTLSAAF